MRSVTVVGGVTGVPVAVALVFAVVAVVEGEGGRTVVGGVDVVV